MKNRRPLLSICIPTYNRADVLEKTLNSIVFSSAFNLDVEVVVSDNCSSDNTRDMVLSFTNRFPNVKYFCNDENVGPDRNILFSLERGSGLFLKINNDYSVFTNDGLAYLITVVKENLDGKPVLYFHQGEMDSPKFESERLDDLIVQEKWGMSWMGSYGYWSEDFFEFQNRDARIDTMFQQFDWFVRSFKKKMRYVCYNNAFTKREPFKSKQGGYNFIEVHTKNYFIQFEELLKDGLISNTALEIVKKHVFCRMIEWSLRLSLGNRGRYSYERQNGFTILKREFGMYNWYYPILRKELVKSFYVVLKGDLLKPFVKRMLQLFVRK